MYTLLILVIYLSFISLGLPDSLLGSAWPTLHEELNVSLSSAGIISMIISISTIVSALNSDKLNNKFGTYKVTSFSILLTSISMFLFSISNNFYLLCLLAIPYGLGAGSIDASLNNYVALHMNARHMSWLHSMWGIGATISPLIMSYALFKYSSWQKGYLIVSIIQLIIFFIVFASKKLWPKDSNKEEDKQESISIIKIIKLKGAKEMLLGFFSYCAIEVMCFVWTASYFSNHFNLTGDESAITGSLFYFGLMGARIIIGFVADKFEDRKIIMASSLFVALFSILIFVIDNYYFSLFGFVMIGFGCGPIYPSFVHATPNNFDRKYSQSIIGVQMAFAYFGTTFSPYLFGLFAQYVDIIYLPIFSLLFGLLIFIFTYTYLKKTK